MKKSTFASAAFLALAGLNGCFHESDPSVTRSSLKIGMAKRGDLELPTGMLKETIYVDKPALCVCDPDQESKLFVLDADGLSAKQVKVVFGQSADSFIEVRRGIKPGDRVIVSDMSAYDSYPRIDLR